MPPPSPPPHTPSPFLGPTPDPQVCLGQVQGTSFGRTVVSLVEAQARSASGDLAGMVFWWSNVVHLRTLLTVMGSPEYAVSGVRCKQVGISSI